LSAIAYLVSNVQFVCSLSVKVGGMRVPLPKHVHEEKPEPAPAKEGEEDVAADPAVKEK
jgi:hypothetical protein